MDVIMHYFDNYVHVDQCIQRLMRAIKCGNSVHNVTVNV